MTLRLGRYETTQRLAAGGMATVYLGRAVGEGGFERLVAIKVMHEHVAAEPEFRAMFLDEARLAARIRHPNVVAVIDIQKTAEGQLFLVMDFVDGPSLCQLRKKLAELGERLPLDVTLRVFVDALSGLHAAHDLTGPDGALLQLVHRDVSPQNILIGKDGITRITDFGVARAEERMTVTRGGQIKGKIAYMPPEQIGNEELDRRGDVYASGVALWEALTGKRLFEANSDAALMRMIVDGATRSPQEIEPSVPEQISEVCMRALALHKEARPATAAAFADELEDAARQAGAEIASTRRVASFLASLPKSVSSYPGSISGSSPSKSRSKAVAPAPALARSGPDERATVPELSPFSSSQSAGRIAPGEATTTRSIVTDGGPIEIPKRSRVPLLVGAAAVLVGLGLGAWHFSTSQPLESPGPVLAESTALPSSSTTSTAALGAATEPSVTLATAATTATVAETASAAGPAPSAAVASAPSAVPSTRPPTRASTQPPRAGPAPPPPPGPKPPVGVGYDPGSL